MPLPSFILVYVREMAFSFYRGYYFIFSFYVFDFSCCFATVHFWSSYPSCICYSSVVLLGAWPATEFSSIYSCRHRMMRHFCGYCLVYAGCASGSWSDLLRVIGRDHFWSICLGIFCNRMCYSIVCCYRFCHTLCYAGLEDHIGSVVFVFGNHLVSPVVHFHCLRSNVFVMKFVMVARSTITF
jgi:hypothetical protein